MIYCIVQQEVLKADDDGHMVDIVSLKEDHPLTRDNSEGVTTVKFVGQADGIFGNKNGIFGIEWHFWY